MWHPALPYTVGSSLSQVITKGLGGDLGVLPSLMVDMSLNFPLKVDLISPRVGDLNMSYPHKKHWQSPFLSTFTYICRLFSLTSPHFSSLNRPCRISILSLFTPRITHDFPPVQPFPTFSLTLGRTGKTWQLQVETLQPPQ
jgi:hypothetical protein